MYLFKKEAVRIRRLRGLVGIVSLGLLAAGSAFGQDGGEAPGDVAAAPNLPVLKIQSERGADARVDYASLTQLGPWDDRNYNLTRDDLKHLSPNEADARDLIPAFYRVELRKRYPDLKTTGLHQYPHSAKARFRVEHGGYLIGDQLYRKSKRVGNEFRIDLSRPYMPNRDWVRKRLTGESRVAPGAETAIAIKPTDTQIVIAGSNGNGGQEMHYSSDGGSTWNSAGTLPQSCCDPTVAWSTDGTKAFTVTLNDFSNDVYESTNNGRTWTRIAQVGTGAVDKEYLHIDKHPTSPYKDHLYLTWHLNNDMMFAKSSNQGSTWTSPVQLSSNSQSGIGSDITSNRSGHVFYVWPSSGFSNGSIWSRRSTDGGSTWDTAVKVTDTQGAYDFPIPAMDTRRAFMYVAAESDLSSGTYADSIYIAYTDSTASTTETPSNNHARIQVAYSRDGGSTWNISTPHATADASTVDRFHPWIAVDENGKVWVVFYSTGADNSRTTVDFYYSVSEDGAQTWSAPTRLTTTSSSKPNDDFEWGDYNGLDLVGGQLLGIYTDNRNEGGGGGDSIDAYVVGTVVTAPDDIFADGFESGNTNNWSQN